jgi:hypothetical protein
MVMIAAPPAHSWADIHDRAAFNVQSNSTQSMQASRRAESPELPHARLHTRCSGLCVPWVCQSRGVALSWQQLSSEHGLVE